jgi:hypothetical protein
MYAYVKDLWGKAVAMKQSLTQRLQKKVLTEAETVAKKAVLSSASAAASAATRASSASSAATHGYVELLITIVSITATVVFMLVSGILALICALALLYIIITTYQADTTVRFNDLHTLWLAEFLRFSSPQDRALVEAAVITVLGSLCGAWFQNLFKVQSIYLSSQELPTPMVLLIWSISGTFIAVIIAVFAYFLVLSGMALGGQGQFQVETLQNVQEDDLAPYATKVTYALIGLAAGLSPERVLAKVAQITGDTSATDSHQP